jgi:hypothetical protein
MAEKNPRHSAAKSVGAAPADASDRMPTNAELLHELRLHGAKPKPRPEPSAVSRRTRDFLLLAGIGSAAIFFLSFRVLGSAESESVLKLALTGVSVYCGLLWFVFYGVMSRY